jgi:ligand-binding sensor protein
MLSRDFSEKELIEKRDSDLREGTVLARDVVEGNGKEV